MKLDDELYFCIVFFSTSYWIMH